MLPPLFALAGGLLGLGQGLAGSGKNKQRRMEEVYNPMALGQQLQARDANANLNPEAAARSAMQQNTATQGAAVGSALNATAGQMANSGDMSNSVGTGVAMSQAAQAAGAPYAQTNAQIAQGVTGQKQQQVAQSESIGRSVADLSNHVSYYNEQPNNVGTRLLGGLVGGLNAATNIFGLLNGKDADTEPGNKESNEAGQDVAKVGENMAESMVPNRTQATNAGAAVGSFGSPLGVQTGNKPKQLFQDPSLDPQNIFSKFNILKSRSLSPR